MADQELPHDDAGDLTSRPPSVEDLVDLCRELNRQGARYLVVGGFAIRSAGYGRSTQDIDLLIDPEVENESRVFKALESLPDKAVLQLGKGEVSQYVVVRVCDEITVDLMASTSGIEIDEAEKDAVVREIAGVPIPFASPKLLWRMKEKTHREKDLPDLVFLRQQYSKEIFGSPDA